MTAKPSVITHSSSSLAPQNQAKVPLEHLFYYHSYPCHHPSDTEWCAKRTIQSILNDKDSKVYTLDEIKTYVEKQYGLI